MERVAFLALEQQFFLLPLVELVLRTNSLPACLLLTCGSSLQDMDHEAFTATLINYSLLKNLSL
jgi:hypothetical protein